MRFIADYHGKSLTLGELASATGIKRATLQRRYEEGDRDAHLWRPLERMRSHSNAVDTFSQRADLQAQRCAEHSKRERQRQEQAARNERNRMRAERLADAKRQHAEAFAQPLIAADLLSKREREAIRANVIGKQRFWTLDSSYGVRR